MCRFVTVGRRTGRPRDIEIWFTVVGGEVALIAGNGPTCNWWQKPRWPSLPSSCASATGGSAARAGAAEGEARRRVGEAMGTKHGGWGGDPSIASAEPVCGCGTCPRCSSAT